MITHKGLQWKCPGIC